VIWETIRYIIGYICVVIVFIFVIRLAVPLVQIAEELWEAFGDE